MKIRVTRPFINSAGPVRIGTILDLPEGHATDFITARLAVLHLEETSVPVVAKPVEQATKNRKNKETR